MKDLIKDTLINTYKTTLGTEADEVIIGDSKSAIFKPEITFTKWNKENSLTIKPSSELALDLASAVTTLSGNKIEYKNSKIGWYVNPDPDNGDNLKFGLILYEKPATNVFQFQLEGWEEFDFFYQPPLANVNPDGSTWEDNILGRSERPADVSGSFAVYHKEKKNHIIGQINYKTGKAFHDYRVKYIDSNGVSIWCELEYDLVNGQRIVTIPSDFWVNAKYPVIANDTFGYTTIGGSNESNYAGYHIICKFAASAGTLSQINFYGKGVYGTMREKTLVYSDSSGYPNAKQTGAGSSWVNVSTTAQWWDSAATTVITAGDWWLSQIPDSESTYYYDSGATNQTYQIIDDFDSPSATMPGGGSGTAQIVSIYATYTPSGGAAEQELIQGAMTTMSKFWG